MNFNTRLALKITNAVSTMWCAYLFCIIALISLPAILTAAFHLTIFPSWMIANGLILIIAWIAQTFIQLVLLSVIMVGQKIQAATTIEAVNDHTTQKHSEITRLHDALRSDILRIHQHFNIKQESNIMDEVKQHVEAALEAVEKLVEDVEHGPEVQLVKDKLTDIRDFLERVDTTPAPAAPANAGLSVPEALGESAPELPADQAPVANPATVDTPPAAPEAPVAPETPAAPEVPETPVASTETAPVSEPSTEDAPATTDTPSDEAPVTNEAGEPVSDPNAAR